MDGFNSAVEYTSLKDFGISRADVETVETAASLKKVVDHILESKTAVVW